MVHTYKHRVHAARTRRRWTCMSPLAAAAAAATARLLSFDEPRSEPVHFAARAMLVHRRALPQTAAWKSTWPANTVFPSPWVQRTTPLHGTAVAQCHPVTTACLHVHSPRSTHTPSNTTTRCAPRSERTAFDSSLSVIIVRRRLS
ncbi:hypothetical protein PSPO01_09243 [Paraphaeosphaeria sporulosa]